MNASPFFWYELMTSDVAAAEKFYATVVGWNSAPFGGEGSGYVVLSAGEAGVGGIMETPQEAAAMGAQPAWLGYIHTVDVDATVEALTEAGGAVHRPASDIPGVGRFAVVADPHGAHFMLMAPQGEDQPAPDPMAPGNIGWRELMAGNLDEAFEFYSGLFGWTKAEAMDMGEMGIYQLFNVDGDMHGAMMNNTPDMPHPYWLFYFNVDNIDAASARVTDNGGQIIFGPMEVPGGSWVIQCVDPQGAMFALIGSRS